MKGLAVFLLVAVVVAHAQVEECPPEQETNWEIEMLLRHEDCHKFYKCTFGKPVEFTCASDLYFNLEKWECDWPYNVDCTGRNDPALTTIAPPTDAPATTIDPTTLEPTTAEPTTSEPTNPEPTTTLRPTTTSITTTHAPECEVEISPQQPSPDAESKEEEDGEEDDGEEEGDSDEKADSDEEADGEEEEGEEEDEVDFLLNGCPVDPHIHWLLPNAEDCNLFYYCVWGEKVLRQCPPGQHFNPVLQVCDWPHSAGCTVSANKHAEARRRLLKQILL